MRVEFVKMHGAGNDFVVIDCLYAAFEALEIDDAVRRRLGDRHTGIGFDQMLVIESPRSADSDAWIRIFNTDGSEGSQCGNGMRCIARYLDDHHGNRQRWRLGGVAGVVVAQVQPPDQVSVQMTVPQWGAAATGCRADSPVTVADAEVAFDLVSMGNPHAVVAVDDVAVAAVDAIGSALQAHFDDGVNVGFVQRLAPGRLALRVYERGVGETLACGTGACAAAVVAMRSDRAVSELAVDLPGGQLMVKWAGMGEPVWLLGPAKYVFEGRIEL